MTTTSAPPAAVLNLAVDLLYRDVTQHPRHAGCGALLVGRVHDDRLVRVALDVPHLAADEARVLDLACDAPRDAIRRGRVEHRDLDPARLDQGAAPVVAVAQDAVHDHDPGDTETQRNERDHGKPPRLRHPRDELLPLRTWLERRTLHRHLRQGRLFAGEQALLQGKSRGVSLGRFLDGGRSLDSLELHRPGNRFAAIGIRPREVALGGIEDALGDRHVLGRVAGVAFIHSRRRCTSRRCER